jgi:hypothetical protein
MAKRVTYSIVDQPDGRFDLLVLVGSRVLHARTGFMTLAETEEEVELLRELMTACGAPVVRATNAGLPGLSQTR